jgi:threonyl-tRNA synthetase
MIDVMMVQDAIGRKWQCSTIQLDFNLPERFGMEYVSAENTRQRPIMIHRALLGSIERFFGILTENFAGAFPLWMAPLQCRLLPVNAECEGACQDLLAQLKDSRLRADMVCSYNEFSSICYMF